MRKRADAEGDRYDAFSSSQAWDPPSGNGWGAAPRGGNRNGRLVADAADGLTMPHTRRLASARGLSDDHAEHGQRPFPGGCEAILRRPGDASADCSSNSAVMLVEVKAVSLGRWPDWAANVSTNPAWVGADLMVIRPL